MVQSDQTNSLDAVETVIDAGAQIQENPDSVLPYMQEDHPATRAIDVSERPRVDGYSGTSAFPLYHYKRRDQTGSPMTEGSLDSGSEQQSDSEPVLMPSQYGNIEEGIDGPEISELFDGMGIDVGVVNPTLHLGLAEVTNDRFAVEMARSYNEYLIDNIDGSDNLKGNLVIAPQVPDRAAEEIDDRADEVDIVGIQMPAAGLHPPPGHRMYDPIYEAARDNDLPISMRATVGMKTFSQQYYWSQSYAEDFTYQPMFANFTNITSMIFNGVPERFSELDFVIQGGGFGYAPYLKHRLDDHYLELGYEIPELEKMPSDYMNESFYWCTQPLGYPDSNYVEKMTRMIGIDNVLFSSDVPHPNTDRPQDLLAHVSSEFEPEAVQKIMGGNAARLFGL